MKQIRCRCCGVSLISGRKFYPQGKDNYVCEFCKAPELKQQEYPSVCIESDEFTGAVPVRYVEQVDIT